MTEQLKHLKTAWDVDRYIVLEEEKVIAVRFSAYEGTGSNVAAEQDTAAMDAVLARVAPRVVKYCTVYAVDTQQVPEFNALYDLDNEDDPFSLMFFFHNKHIKVDCRTGNNNKINFPIRDDQDLIAIIDAVFIAGKEGKGLAASPKGFERHRSQW